MGKDWLIAFLLIAANPAPPASTPQDKAPSSPAGVPQLGEDKAVISSTTPPVQAPVRCDARQYRGLVGRTLSDVLTQKLPAGTRIVRVGDPQLEPLGPGRLVIEINRSTRVGRIYCS
ncbi:hypothetical protein PbB2_00770 [Candidatus Phycosocius bacilliformis]|uniref:Peptidase inhibitor I78 family protein n=1 Tax=Candidatus Phycosocius bacilliformis TaxID=1445552 RepID=A0A2P2E7S8_9PROT|nr:hypothetical protein [Candidatus Phycosocius bacilliformis]GBF57110.1 hypothetical protein PbB2_00770 [Candidatus Phycosocius bacilliformis]